MELWAIGALVALAVAIAYGVRRTSTRTVPVDDEVDAVLAAAGACFQLEGDTITAAHFVRVALCVPAVAHIFERRGHPVTHVASALSMQRGGFAPRTEEASSRTIALDDELQGALQEAAVLARQRDQVDATTPLVIEALTIHSRGPTGRYLDELDLVFEDHGLAAALDAGDDVFLYLCNDERTPMDVVVTLLREEAGLGAVKAWFQTMHTHFAGYAVLGPFADDDAAAEVRGRIEERARRDGWPLRLRREPPDVGTWRRRDRGLLP